MQKSSIQRLEVRTAYEAEFSNFAWECWNGVRKAKAQLKLRLARNVKGSKKNFYHNINYKRLSKESVGLLLNGAGNLVITESNYAEVLSACSTSVVTVKVSQASGWWWWLGTVSMFLPRVNHV